MEDAIEGDHVCSSQLSHFDHVDEFMNHLDVLLNPSSDKASTQALERLTTIVSNVTKYNHPTNITLFLARLLPRTITFT